VRKSSAPVASCRSAPARLAGDEGGANHRGGQADDAPCTNNAFAADLDTGRDRRLRPIRRRRLGLCIAVAEITVRKSWLLRTEARCGCKRASRSRQPRS
jgi:hypothetical protein